MKNPVALLPAFCFSRGFRVDAQPSNSTVRAYFFRARTAAVPLAHALPPNTQLYQTWPKAREIPAFIPAAAVDTDGSEQTLLGPAIHVQSGDTLKLTLKNDIPYTGLSIHLHGFSYGGQFQYDGAVGVSQCPVAEEKTFVYDVVVHDRPGTYWYHTSSGHFGVEAYDAIRGPLVVHPKPKSQESNTLVDVLNSPSRPLGCSPLAYQNERILFLQDGFLSSSAALRYAQQVGSMLPPPSVRDDGIIAATSPWQFGTCNGKLRDVLHVASNQKYTFRVINGGQHHALRFSIDGFPLTVVAADAQPVAAYVVDEIVLESGERFDVEVLVSEGAQEGESYWIRADTLESQSQGFQNGIRAIMRVSDPQVTPGDGEVPDPPQSIMMRAVHQGTRTLNCYTPSSGCIPVTSLYPLSTTDVMGENTQSELSTKDAKDSSKTSEIHYVDTHFQPAPQYGHFISIDDSVMTQNEFPPVAMISRTFRPAKSVHPHSLALRVASASSAIIVWRTTLLMDVPIHLHGHAVEILDVTVRPELQQSCNLQSCELSRAYESKDKLEAFDRTPHNRTVKKDTFIIPSGGAVVTRMHTGNPGLWLVSGQKDVHQEDGLAFVLIVGDYLIPAVDDWPVDFPTCDATLMKQLRPYCKCYIDKEAPFRRGNPDEKLCSRSHLCRHALGQAAHLDSHVPDRGFHIQSGWDGLPEFLLAPLCAVVVVTLSVLIAVLPARPRSDGSRSHGRKRVRQWSSSPGVGTRLPGRCDAKRYALEIAVSGSHGRRCDSGRESLSMLGMSSVVSEQLEEENGVPGVAVPPSPPPPRRLNTGDTNTGDLLLRRSALSTFSTFDRILSERGHEDKDDRHASEAAVEVLPRGYRVEGKSAEEVVHRGSSLRKQLLYLCGVQWHAYFPACVSLVRCVEVAGLAGLAGACFRGAGRDGGQATVRDASCLLLFLAATWSFPRLFAAVPSQHAWFRSARFLLGQRRFSLVPVFGARVLVVAACEGGWAFLAVALCLGAAGLAGDGRSLLRIAVLLTCNNMSYLSLGSVLGMSGVPSGMMGAAFFMQVSVLAAGALTALPSSFAWAKYCSPFYWTVRGLLKSFFRRSDTFECVQGSSSRTGANQCYIEFDPLIEQFKRRGLPIASYNDAAPVSILTESLVLVTFSVGLQAIIFLRCFFAYYKVNWDDLKGQCVGAIVYLGNHGVDIAKMKWCE